MADKAADGSLISKQFELLQETPQGVRLLCVNKATLAWQIIYVYNNKASEVTIDRKEKTILVPVGYIESFKPVEFMGGLAVLRIGSAPKQ